MIAFPTKLGTKYGRGRSRHLAWPTTAQRMPSSDLGTGSGRWNGRSGDAGKFEVSGRFEPANGGEPVNDIPDREGEGGGGEQNSTDGTRALRGPAAAVSGRSFDRRSNP